VPHSTAAKAIWWLNTACLYAWLAVAHSARLGAGPSILVLVAALAFAFVIGELGRYPYARRHKVRHRFPYWLFMFGICVLTSFLVAMHPPGWYPTNSSLWILVPFLGFGLVSSLRGWGYEPRGFR
jgi:hypothetical protein